MKKRRCGKASGKKGREKRKKKYEGWAHLLGKNGEFGEYFLIIQITMPTHFENVVLPSSNLATVLPNQLFGPGIPALIIYMPKDPACSLSVSVVFLFLRVVLSLFLGSFWNQ